MAEPASWTGTVDAVLDRLRTLPGALLPILREIQNQVGYVPPEAVPRIAEVLNLSRAEVHGVVTFYHDFRSEPAGRHMVHVCRAESCQSLGAEGRRLFLRFLGEGASLGAIGGAVGSVAGIVLADRLERSLFGVPLTFSVFWIAAPFLLSILLASAAGLPSVGRALRIEAITALRNE